MTSTAGRPAVASEETAGASLYFDKRYDRLSRLSGGRLAIGDASIQSLVTRFGSPLYVVDGAEIDRQLDRLRQTLIDRQIGLYYSIKANPSLAIVRRCAVAGLGLDACSPGDLGIAGLAGVSPSRTSYTGVALDRSEIARLCAQGVLLNLDSLSEVEKLAALRPGLDVGLRIAPGIEAGFHEHCRSGLPGQKFGVGVADAFEATATLEQAGCRLTRLHCHLGSSISTTAPFLEAARVLLGVAARLPAITAINLGGGLGARYHPDDSEFPLEQLGRDLAEEAARFAASTRRRIAIELEPGELVVSEAVYLLSRVKVLKTWRAPHSVRIAIVDASMNLLPAHTLYGTYHHVWVDGRPQPGESSHHYNLYGCTNQTGDKLATARPLPELQEGDTLIFRNAGAYAYSRSTQFNQRPRPAEVWVDGANVTLTREAETVSDLIRGQRWT